MKEPWFILQLKHHALHTHEHKPCEEHDAEPRCVIHVHVPLRTGQHIRPAEDTPVLLPVGLIGTQSPLI